jgi:hypothetical protein
VLLVYFKFRFWWIYWRRQYWKTGVYGVLLFIILEKRLLGMALDIKGTIDSKQLRFCRLYLSTHLFPGWYYKNQLAKNTIKMLIKWKNQLQIKISPNDKNENNRHKYNSTKALDSIKFYLSWNNLYLNQNWCKFLFIMEANSNRKYSYLHFQTRWRNSINQFSKL